MTNNNEYTYALGRRKTSSATVRLYRGSEESTFNERKLEELFSSKDDMFDLLSPFRVTDTVGDFYFTVKAKGGGTTGQRQAARLAISRALVKVSEDYKAELKKNGLLTRDSRMVERKKPGLKKARKAPQFSKR